MAQKPVLRGEVGARVLRVRSDVRGHGQVRLYLPLALKLREHFISTSMAWLCYSRRRALPVYGSNNPRRATLHTGFANGKEHGAEGARRRARARPRPFFEATPPGAAPKPRLKPGPVFVTSGGVITYLALYNVFLNLAEIISIEFSKSQCLHPHAIWDCISSSTKPKCPYASFRLGSYSLLPLENSLSLTWHFQSCSAGV